MRGSGFRNTKRHAKEADYAHFGPFRAALPRPDSAPNRIDRPNPYVLSVGVGHVIAPTPSQVEDPNGRWGAAGRPPAADCPGHTPSCSLSEGTRQTHPRSSRGLLWRPQQFCKKTEFWRWWRLDFCRSETRASGLSRGTMSALDTSEMAVSPPKTGVQTITASGLSGTRCRGAG